MDKKLNPEEFTNIFVDSLPNSVNDLHSKAFNSCINNFDYPYLAESEKTCLESYSRRYMQSIDYVLINFSKRVLQWRVGILLERYDFQRHQQGLDKYSFKNKTNGYLLLSDWERVVFVNDSVGYIFWNSLISSEEKWWGRYLNCQKND